MYDTGTVKYQGIGPEEARRVQMKFTGSTAILKGAPLVVDWTNFVPDEVKAITAVGDTFIGIAAEAYAAVTGGQLIDVFVGPGKCLALVDGTEDTVVGGILHVDLSLLSLRGEAAGVVVVGGVAAIALTVEADALTVQQTAGTNDNYVYLLPPGGAFVVA